MCIIIKDKEIIYQAYLKDNSFTIFHIIGPECKNCIIKGLNKLSFDTKIKRFNTPIVKFSKSQIDYLTNINNYDHLALGAGMYHISNDPGMAIARYIRENKKSNRAEIAIVIIDEYQNKGLGTLLTCLLIKYGIKNKIHKFFGYVAPDNLPMIKVFDKFNAKNIGYNENMLCLEFDLLKNKQKAFKILMNFEYTKICTDNNYT